MKITAKYVDDTVCVNYYGPVLNNGQGDQQAGVWAVSFLHRRRRLHVWDTNGHTWRSIAERSNDDKGWMMLGSNDYVPTRLLALLNWRMGQ
ncbi:hypothetical protein [Paraburkholderia unamae]|uniref:Uncharacterized protein n=1 Tax=Paraburkholderia unamae TaxID=219649 RepID=A0ACC6RGL2_9BURK